MNVKKALKTRLAAFSRREDGGATMEAVLWIPMYLVFMALIFDGALIFHGQSKVQRMAQDMNRLAIAGYYDDGVGGVDTSAMKDAAEAVVQARYKDATASINADADSVQTFLTVPSKNIAVIGLLPALVPMSITVSAAHMREP